MNDSIILLEKRIEVLEQNHNRFIASSKDNQYSSMHSSLILEYVKKLNENSNKNLENKMMDQMELIKKDFKSIEQKLISQIELTQKGINQSQSSISESLNTIKNKFLLYTQKGELSVIEEEVQKIGKIGVKTQEEVRTTEITLKKIESQILRINASLEKKIAEKNEQFERKVTTLQQQINKFQLRLDAERAKLQKQKLEDVVYIGEKFYQCFKVHENKIFYLRGHQEHKKLFSTQVTLKARIPHNKIYRFEMKIVESRECCIAVGIADSRQREERSPKQCNSVVYWGYNGKLSYGYDGKWKYKMEGKGFKVGQLVIVEVQLAKGQIKWFVGTEERASISTIALEEKQIQFWPSILFVHEGDCIQWSLP